MRQSIKTLHTDQKTKIILFICLLGLSFLMVGISFNIFKVGLIFSVLCWIITGIIESSYKQSEPENSLLSFSPLNFLIVGSAGIGTITLLMLLLFL
ncbi:MAG: hypothetical protein ACFFDT_19720 [Candidatus Hodarchaeota archaeon]